MTTAVSRTRTKTWIARVFTIVEDVVYIGLAVMLAGSALVLLWNGILAAGQSAIAGTLPSGVAGMLDRILLILLVVELLYTVQVSFRAHAVVPEPFLLVGLIAAIRRVLVLTAEFGEARGKTEERIEHFALELAVLTALIVGISVSLVLLGRRETPAAAERA
jgi:uncharacterized membrane protein (DUF373 family)